MNQTSTSKTKYEPQFHKSSAEIKNVESGHFQKVVVWKNKLSTVTHCTKYEYNATGNIEKFKTCEKYLWRLSVFTF